MMPANGAGFLGGARDRLLPVSVPFRYFLAASLFHVAAWAVLLAGAADLTGFAGGPGLILAAVHLTTLGVLAMSAMGAAFQLLPVVTRRAMGAPWPAAAAFWVFAPGVALLTWGMGRAATGLMLAGSALSIAGLAIFALLTLRNLARAGAVAVVAGHGWAALAALAVLAGLGATLVADFAGGFLPDRAVLAGLHAVLGIFGFMGLLVAGFSLVLIPMFALSRSLPTAPGWAGLAAGVSGVGFAAAAALSGMPALWWPALGAGLLASGIHLALMQLSERRAMRRRLGLPFALLRAARWALVATLMLAGAGWLGAPVPNAPVLIGFLLIAGWLLTFLMGVLSRILPFLASMHASGRTGLPLLMSDLTCEPCLRLHAGAHFAGIAAVATGIVADQTPLIRLGAGLGLAGALGFAAFAFNVALQLWKFRHAKPAQRGKPAQKGRPT
ncbi:MAG TPA: hypothetical protein ENJ52_14905 [Aliiroseovarius sp.]|nr:hypothetical protein [Aliiroseovarius sp.]